MIKLLIVLGIIYTIYYLITGSFRIKLPKKNKFLLKIEQSWFSPEYVQFKYSINGGFTWKNIYVAERPLFSDVFSYDWYLCKLTYPLRDGNFDNEKKMFSSYEKIKEWEKEQKEKYFKGLEETKKTRKEIIENRKKALEKANKF